MEYRPDYRKALVELVIRTTRRWAVTNFTTKWIQTGTICPRKFLVRSPPSVVAMAAKEGNQKIKEDGSITMKITSARKLADDEFNFLLSTAKDMQVSDTPSVWINDGTLYRHAWRDNVFHYTDHLADDRTARRQRWSREAMPWET